MLPNKRYPTSSKLMHQMYRKYVPNIMDDSLSLYEQMIAVIEHINNLVRTSDSLSDELTKDMNELITEVNNIRDFSLPENVISVLQEWHESGYLNIIINENLQTQMDDYRSTIDNKLVSMDQQLAQNAKKTNGFITLSDYCEGSDDDTVGFLEALAIAKAEKKSIYVDGVYTIKENIVIENKTIPMIFGDGRGVSVLRFDHASGFAIENKSYYSQPFKMKDLIIRQADLSKKLSGVKVKYDGWGGAIDLDNVNIEYFTDVVLDITDGSQSIIKNVMLNGGVYNNKRSATLLQINYTPNIFSNINTFENVTFFNGRIGIQDFGGTLYTFTSCIFESLDLFCHVVNNPLLSHKHKFDGCWFEQIERGIINARMNDDLTPYTPVTDKARVIDLFTFTNSTNGGQIPNPFLYEVIEPEYFDNFSVNTGHPIYYFMKPVELKNNWAGTLEVTKPEFKRISVQGRLSAGVSATGTEITTLPAGYRPTTASVTAKVVNASRSSVIGDLVIYTTGSVRWVSDTPIIAGDYIDINISFDIK